MRQLCSFLCLVMIAASATAAPKRKGKTKGKTPAATAPAEGSPSDAAPADDATATPVDAAPAPTAEPAPASAPAPSAITATPLPASGAESSAPSAVPAAATSASYSLTGGGRFGDVGVIAPGGSVAFAFVRESGNSDVVMQLQPVAMYFIMENLAVGAGIGLGWTSASSDTLKYAFSPMVGYNVWLADGVSLFATLGIDFRKGTMAIGNAITDAQNDAGGSKNMDLTVGAPLLLHLGNFFVGGGPDLRIQLMSNDSFTPDDRIVQFGLMTTIGGWL